MALIYMEIYQHHDPGILSPVLDELIKRNHSIIIRPFGYQAFIESFSKKCIVLVSDVLGFGHAEGMAIVKRGRINNIPSVSFQHGVPVHREKHMHTADYLCMWGEAWKDNFIPVFGQQVFIGNPRMDQIYNYDRDKARERIHNKYGEGNALLIPAIRPDADTIPVDENAMNRANYFIEQARATGWDGGWIVRPHPADVKYDDRMAAYRHIVETLPAQLNMPNDPDASLYDILATIEYVFGISTVLIEALAFGCKIDTVGMPYLPEDRSIKNLFYALDGKAASRAVDLIEMVASDGLFTRRSAD